MTQEQINDINQRMSEVYLNAPADLEEQRAYVQGVQEGIQETCDHLKPDGTHARLNFGGIEQVYFCTICWKEVPSA